MKIIYILSHAYKGEFTREEIHKIDSLNHRYALRMSRYTDRYQVECWWTERRISLPLVAVEGGITYRAFPASPYRFPYRYISLSLLRALQRECRRGQVLVFIHFLKGKWTTLIPLFIRGVPIVIQQHSEGIHYTRRKLLMRPWMPLFSVLEHLAYRRIDRFFLLYKEAERELERYVGPAKTTILSCGVDFGRFRPMEKAKAREALGLEPSGRYILFVGRINERKGVRYLIEAMPAILRDYPSTRLLLVGGIRRERIFSDLKELIERLGIKERVCFLGGIPNERLPLFYNAADVFVLPSLTEGLGLVLVEAAACNCPIIGTEVGGILDLMDTVKKGILVPPRSADAIARAVKKVFENPSSYQDLREMARPYSWDTILEKTVEVFEDLRQRYYPDYRPFQPDSGGQAG